MSKSSRPEKSSSPLRLVVVVVLIVAILAGCLCLYLALSSAASSASSGIATTQSAATNGSTSAQSSTNSSTITENPDGSITVNRDKANEQFQEYLSKSTVKSQEVASQSSAVLTEADAVAAFNARGFDGSSVVASYAIDGSYTGDAVISASSTTKHPFYSVAYKSSRNVVWMVYCYGNTFNAVGMADSLRYKNGLPATYSATDSICVYRSTSNTLYDLIPPSDEAVVVKIDSIDASTLDKR